MLHIWAKPFNKYVYPAEKHVIKTNKGDFVHETEKTFSFRTRTCDVPCYGSLRHKPDENPEESTSQTDAEPVSITVTENWDFSVGFYPVITPMVSSTYGAGFWSRNFYNTLVSYDDNGKIQGELAETWEISDDGKTYTFHLRDGVKFSDGTPLTSEAVKMTLEAVVTNLVPRMVPSVSLLLCLTSWKPRMKKPL